jgi:hypothetical protein
MDDPAVITREQIYGALFALLTPLLAPGAEDGAPDGEAGMNGSARPGTPTAEQPFNLVSREVIEVQRVPPALQPVLFMYEMDEDFGDSGDGLTPLTFVVILIFGVTSPKGTPGQTLLNPLIDRVVDALQPPGGEDDQRLPDADGNPLVEWVRIKGKAGKNHGNNATDPDFRQASYYLPLEIRLASA